MAARLGPARQDPAGLELASQIEVGDHAGEFARLIV
jgi:hypothetical protein